MRLAGFEMGGTVCIAALSEGRATTGCSEPPTFTPGETLAAFDVLCEWDAMAPLAAIGVASFGLVRVDRAAGSFGRIFTRLKQGWSGADLLGPFRKRFACPLALGTDVIPAMPGHGTGVRVWSI